MKTQPLLIIAALFLLTAAFTVVLFFYGDAGFIISDEIILWQLRFPKIVVAFFAGGLLASSGLLLQVFFQNPLARGYNTFCIAEPVFFHRGVSDG